MFKKIWKLLGRPQSAATVPGAGVAEPPAPTVIPQTIPRKELDSDAVKIVQRLTRFDHDAYLVGGCVRDLLLGRHPKDYDVGTSATPRQIKRLFRNCRIIGRRFRLAHIYFRDGKIIEVATFRSSDADPSGGGADAVEDDRRDAGRDDPRDDSRDDLLIRDDNQFGTMEQDALRRDFTINQLFYDVNEERVIDHTDGLGDLQRRLVRTIGDPEIRFREDPIRILRAIKFAARLDFAIEPETKRALLATRGEISKAAPPRVLEELNRFSRGAAGRPAFELLRETGVFEAVLPELARAYRDDRTWTRALAMLGALDEDQRGGNEVQTGAILAALLLPVLWSEIGWGDDGEIHGSRGDAVRDTVDGLLRDIALRLRISRREQERCRQIVVAIHRMLPDKTLRPRGRASLKKRAVLHEALVLLSALAGTERGEFAAASAAWSGEPTAPAAAPDRHVREIDDDDDEAGDRPRRRRRRRGGRRRRKSEGDREGGRAGDAADDADADADARTDGRADARADDDAGGETGDGSRSGKGGRRRRGKRGGRGRRGGRSRSGEAAASSASAASSKGADRAARNGNRGDRNDRGKRGDRGERGERADRGEGGRGGGSKGGRRPSKWDDDYFFSALPSVPKLEGDPGDRYGAQDLNLEREREREKRKSERGRDEGGD